jgi:ParB family chromosome partitioning protein
LLGDAAGHDEERAGDALRHLAVSDLAPGRYQPRREIPNKTLSELADSIRAQGVVQPLVVRPVLEAEQKYEIVAGERRWRAARLAGLKEVPAIVRPVSDQAALAIALIENLQREDLNPIDQAQALSRLSDEFSLTHQQVADAIGRSRPAVSNLLRLLELDVEVQQMLSAGELEMGHARALLGLGLEKQLEAAQKIVSERMSVREVERFVKEYGGQAPPGQQKRSKAQDQETRWFQEQLKRELGQSISVRTRANGHSSLRVSFENLEQLQTTLEQLEKLVARLRRAAGPRVRDQKS